MKKSANDWERICRAAFYAHSLCFRSRRTVDDIVEKLLSLLLTAGVDPFQKDNEGISAWDIAQSSSRKENREFFGQVLGPNVMKNEQP